jgi:hypothetical protein
LEFTFDTDAEPPCLVVELWDEDKVGREERRREERWA